jgi:hypothetical protein
VANVQSLVNQAIFLSVQDAQFQPDINAGYQAFALNELNNILDEWRDLIPYGSQVTFNNVTNLLSTNFVEVDTVQYVIISSGTNNAAFFLKSVSESAFKRQETIIGLSAFPNIYYFDQLLQRINIYPAPTQTNYQFIVRGRISQINLGLYDDIPANMPRFQSNALISELAFRTAARYGADWDAKKESTRNGLLLQLLNKKEIDLSPDNNIVFGTPGLSYNAPFPTWYYISGGGT